MYRECKLKELHDEAPEFDGIEAIRLKDGRILYDENLGFGGLLQKLKPLFIVLPDFESIGYVDTDGNYNSLVHGEEELYDYFAKKAHV